MLRKSRIIRAFRERRVGAASGQRRRFSALQWLFALVYVVVFLVALVVSFVVHLPLAVTRRVAVRVINDQASKSIQGSIDIGTISQLWLGGVEARDVVVRDPDGAVVLEAPVLRAYANWLSILDSLMPWGEGIHVVVPWIHASQVNVVFRHDDNGVVTLGTTFLPTKQGPEPVGVSDSGGPVVDLRAIEVASVRVKGHLGGLSPVDWRARTVRGRVYVGQGRVEVDTSPFALDVHRVLENPIHSTLDYHFRSPSLMWSDVVARYEDLSISGQVQLKDAGLMLDVDLPQTQSEVINAFLPQSVRITEPVQGKLVANGPFTKLNTTVKLELADTRMDATGTIALVPQLRADLDMHVNGLNLQQIVDKGPQTSIDAKFAVRGAISSRGKPHLRLQGEVTPKSLYGVDVPQAQVEALVDGEGVSGVMHLQEPGMPVRADFWLSDTQGLRVTATANAPILQAVPRLKGKMSGYAVAQAQATWLDGKLNADVSVQAGNLQQGDIKLGVAHVQATVHGLPEALRVDGWVQGERLMLAELAWQRMRATVRGALMAPDVTLSLQDEARPNLEFDAGFDLRNRIAANNVSIKVGYPGRGEGTPDVQTDEEIEPITVTSDGVELRGGSLDLGAIAVDGLGEPLDAMVRVGPNGFDVRAVSDGVDLEKLARLLPWIGSGLEGTVGLDVDLHSVGAASTGCVRVDVRDARVRAGASLTDIDVSIGARFSGNRVHLAANGSIGGEQSDTDLQGEDVALCVPPDSMRTDAIARAKASASVVLEGPPLELLSWMRATGTAQLQQLEANLEGIRRVVEPLFAEKSMVAGMKFDGVLRARGEAVRDDSETLPSWAVSFNSQQLGVELAQQGPVNSVQGVDVVGAVSMDRSGLFQSLVCLNEQRGLLGPGKCVPGTQGVLASFQASAQLDYRQIVEKPSAILPLLKNTPVDALVAVKDQSLQALLTPVGLHGALPIDAEQVTAKVKWHGTWLQPEIDYQLGLARAAARDVLWRAPLSVCLRGQYDGQQAWMHTYLRSSKQPLGVGAMCASSPEPSILPLGYVQAKLKFPWSEWVLGRGHAKEQGQEPSWQADVKAVIDGFELSEFPAFSDRGLGAKAKLVAIVEGLGQTPNIDVQLGLEKLRTGTTVDYAQGNVRVKSDEKGIYGSVALIDVDDKGDLSSSLTLRVNTEQVQWQGGWRPVRDGSKPVNVQLETKRFKLGVLTPWLQPTFSYLEGELSGRATAVWSPSEQNSKISELYFFLDKGAFQVPAIGQEFLSVKAVVQAANSERVFVEGFRAESLTGSLRARAAIDLEGLSMRHADLTLWTPENESIRLTFAGIPVGDLKGTIRVGIDPTPTQNNVDVEFDKVSIELPRTDMRSVQTLEDNPEIDVLPQLVQVQGAEKSAVTPWVVNLKTPNHLVLQRSDMLFRLLASEQEQEKLQLVYPDPDSGEATLNGHVLVYEGRLDVLGHRFFTEENNARVIFDGNPADPKLGVTARWDAADGTRVFVDATGPLRNPRLQLRSEPALPSSQLLSLVLFGTTGQDITAGTSAEGGESSAAAEVGGGVAAAGINMLLQDVTPRLSARIDTGKGHTPSPTVAVQVSQNVTAEATYVPEESTLDKGDRYLLSVDWRFLRYWSLRITRGNVGTSILDVLWQYRY